MQRPLPKIPLAKPCPKCYTPMRPVKGQKETFECPTHGIPSKEERR